MNNNQNLAIDTVRILSAEAVEKAKSGHPGLPMGAAPIAYTLFSDFLKFNPENPKFYDRDRFVLSAGHGSMLYYSLLHIFGYNLTMDDIKNFRQVGSKTPGHPEYNHTEGVETTTGPLGQGIANAVGMAIAETHLAAKFNKDGFDIVDHYTYALSGDGCMQEGIEYEAASLAGTLKLNKLIVFYDSNDITIEGSTDGVFSEDVAKRHIAQGWQVITVSDANDTNAIKRAVRLAKSEKHKPSLIICKSKIGYGSPLEGLADSHGAPLGVENLEKSKKYFNWNYAPFTLPEEVQKIAKKYKTKGRNHQKRWQILFDEYKLKFPELAKEFENYMENKMPDLENIDDIWHFEKGDATRNSSGTVLNKIASLVPNLMGGSADLAPSNKSAMKNRSYYSFENRLGTNMQFGVREHAMAAICNGMYLHGGLRVYCATFFVFTDYMKNAMRLSALMDIPVTYILTHDSIGVGEDGPTHQPIEQLVSLRSVPNMKVFRPCDARETAAAWTLALTQNSPTCLVLSRQNLPLYENSGKLALKGGYILADSKKQVPDVMLLASGSEVEICMKAKDELLKLDIDARVVSMPCFEVFDKQSEEYKESVLPKAVRARVCVEAGSSYSWHKYCGLDGKIISMDTFGASGPADKLFKLYGFTAENVVEKAREVVGR